MHEDDESAEDRISGRRSVDDGARLLIAENALTGVRQELKEVRSQYASLAEGQDILSGVLIGRPSKDGTITIGLAEQTREIRAKQNESGEKLDAVIADMGDLKTAQADQAKILTAHGTALERIEAWFATGVTYLKTGIDLAWKGAIGLIGVGLLHLLTLWWGTIVNFFTTWGPAASTAAVAACAPSTIKHAVSQACAAATKGHLH